MGLTLVQVDMKGWKAFLQDAPSRVVEVIEEGPFPLAEYSGSKLTYADKKKGMMRYKGGEGRGAHRKMKSGTPAVIYFDPNFCEGESRPIEVPEHVLDRHTKDNVMDVFEQL